MTTDDDLARAIAPYAPLTAPALRAHLASLGTWEPEALDALALAFAASTGQSGAARTVTIQLGPAMRAAAARAGYSATIGEDAAQEALIVMLLGGEGNAPALATYRGRAPLTAWAKTIALRIAARIHAAHATVGANQVGESIPGADELVGRSIRAELRGSIVEAFNAAAAQLSMFDRELLRAVIVEDASIEKLATRHGVHRATVARWIGRARQKLDDTMRAELARALVLSPAEVSSVLRTVHTSLALPIEPLMKK